MPDKKIEVVRKYGAKKDAPDPRDRKMSYPHKLTPLPAMVDEREFCGPIKNQGDEGSCTGHAGSSSVEWQFRKWMKETPILSPQNLYVNELTLEGSFPSDDGAQTRSICKVLNTQGVCEEAIQPYVSGKLAKPTPAQVENALKYKLGGYHRLAGLDDFLTCLGDPVPWPVLVGFNVFESFEGDDVAKAGLMPVPNTKKERLLGGHEVLAVGYDRNGQLTNGIPVAICQNSWGPEWGVKGFFYMPLEVLGDPNQVSDLWVIHIGHWS